MASTFPQSSYAADDTELPEAHGIIPARFASSRFPGKPLVPLLGKPMFWHVWNRARQCPLLHSVTLATDDTRIAKAAKALDVPCVLTSQAHISGTDRVYEAACLLKLSTKAIVVNIQGDEPAFNPTCLTSLITAFADKTVQVATLAHVLPMAEASNPDKVKVVLAANGNALYFSRALIPFCRDISPSFSAPLLGHIGLYAFTMQALHTFVHSPPSLLERTEKLEQLRLLEQGIPIRVILTDTASQGVDRPEDLALVLPLLEE